MGFTRCIVVVAISLNLSGCGPAYDGSLKKLEIISPDDAYKNAKENSTEVFPDNKGPVINDGNFKHLVKFNHYLSDEFMMAADRARTLGKYGNGILILTAVAYGVGSVNGVAPKSLNRGLIVGLGLSEGLRYTGPNASSLAFLTAADQSACIAAAASGQSNTKGRSAILWEAMTNVQTDLRRGLTRKPVGLFKLATGFLNPTEFQSEEYDLTRAEQRIRAYSKYIDEENKNSLKAKLLKCLAEPTTGSG